MKTCIALVIAASLCAAIPAQAQRLDLATFRCQTYLTGNKDTAALILMWIEGYYSEENASPIIDFDKLKERGNRFSEYCSKNPSQSLINAADETLAK